MTTKSIDHFKRSSLNFFTAHTVDRLSVKRRDETWIETRLQDDSTYFIPVWHSKNLFALSEPARSVLLKRTDLGDLLTQADDIILLGEDNNQAYFALNLTPTDEADLSHLTAKGQFEDLRLRGTSLKPEEGALLAHARGMVYWHQTHCFCGKCGQATHNAEGGYMRVCTAEDCQHKHFPRTDPAIIVLVNTGDKCLLGRQAVWPPGRYSTIAGFVEPGETLEHAVKREVMEETGIEVAEVYYHSSQPWPFPTSLMLGYIATAASEDIHLNDEELEDARWFSRAELAAALQADEVRLPPDISISHRLIETWFNEGELGPLSQFVTQSW